MIIMLNKIALLQPALFALSFRTIVCHTCFFWLKMKTKMPTDEDEDLDEDPDEDPDEVILSDEDNYSYEDKHADGDKQSNEFKLSDE